MKADVINLQEVERMLLVRTAFKSSGYNIRQLQREDGTWGKVAMATRIDTTETLLSDTWQSSRFDSMGIILTLWGGATMQITTAYLPSGLDTATRVEKREAESQHA